MIRRFSFLILGVIFFAVLCIPKSFAQIAGGGVTGSETDISISMSPENPTPDETVTLSLNSFSTDLSAAEITWSVDGTVVQTGIDKTTLSLTTKGIGQKTSVTVVITSPDGTSITKNTVIDPMGVDLLWQTMDSAVPPLYRGKAMPASEATIKFVAIPEMQNSSGTMYAPSDLIYNWLENSDPSPNDSGYGKDSFTVTTSDLNPNEAVGVSVQSRDATVTASNYTTVTPVDPMILWYEDSPLYGPMYDRSLGNDYTVSGSDITILAEPYFLSPSDQTSPDLTYTWTLNGGTIDTPQIPNVLFLHRDSSSPGDADLDLSISNANKLFQSVESTLTLHLQ